MVSHFGTWGAFIKMKSAMPTRWELLKIGAAGPLSGFLLAVVFLGFGLAEVTPQPVPEPTSQDEEVVTLVRPMIYRIASFFFLKQPIPEGHGVFLFREPLLLAAWVGIFLTMLNLLPIAQLDGGHVVYALTPRKHHLVSRAMMLLMVAAGFLWPGWWFFAVLVFLFLRLGHPPTLNDAAPLRARGKLLGLLAILLFLLTFTPRPF
jgi:membrane-associated protease RseP (regulator of RpoE activity)